jgi:hypothetical protein
MNLAVAAVVKNIKIVVESKKYNISIKLKEHN